MKTMIILEHLGFLESNYTIFCNVNKIVENSLEEISIVPLDVSNKMMAISTAIMNPTEISCFKNGMLLSTKVKHAQESLSCVTNADKVLYLWDLDWMYEKIPYIDLYTTLNHPDLKIIVRSELHQKALMNILEDTSNIIGVLEFLDLEKIWNLLSKTKT